MERRFMYIIFLLLMISVVGSFYFNEFNIKNENKSIQNSIKNYLNREKEDKVNPLLIDFLRVDHTNTYLAFFQLESKIIGYSQLTKGLNGKLKIKRSGYGGDKIIYQKIVTSDGVYGILMGNNPNLLIDHISVKLANENYSFITDVSKDATFIKYNKFPSNIKKGLHAKITVFNKYNYEID